MESHYQKALLEFPLGAFRYFKTIGSTNDEALIWATNGALDLSLIVADEQTSGRGRMDRKWFTPPNSALAISLILHPSKDERTHPSRTTGLLAVSLTETLREFGVTPQIKWPNDVLLNGCKVAGILVESIWTGESLDALVLGMGVNVLITSIPQAEELSFPATSIETALGHTIDRALLLKKIISRALKLRPQLGTDKFLNAWEKNLAFRGQQVLVEGSSGEMVTGELLGLERDGSLRLRNEHGKTVTVHFGDVHLRPLP